MNQMTLISDEEYKRISNANAERQARKDKDDGWKMGCGHVSDVDGSAYYCMFHPDNDRKYIVSPDGLPEGESPKPCDCPIKNHVTDPSRY